MDPLTQGLLGGAAAQACFGGRLPRSAWLVGVAAGMAADLDIFIRPASDPLGGLTYHRHFTHALVFAPLGGLLCALPFLLWPGRADGRLRAGARFRGARWAVIGAAIAAYLTHGPLDALTSYGTLLWWPFSSARVSWDAVGIIDPVVTLALLAAVVWSVRAARPSVARAGLAFVLAYFGLGLFQRERALDAQREMALARGHTVERSRVMPQPLSLVLWRSIYEADGDLHADGIRVPFLGGATVWPGASAPVARFDGLVERRRARPEDRAAFDRFAWFADGYVAVDAGDDRVVGDMRYAPVPDRFASMWGLRLSADAPARFTGLAGARAEGARRLWAALTGADERFVPVAGLVRELKDGSR